MLLSALCGKLIGPIAVLALKITVKPAECHDRDTLLTLTRASGSSGARLRPGLSSASLYPPLIPQREGTVTGASVPA
jgi:hypothetical protein